MLFFFCVWRKWATCSDTSIFRPNSLYCGWQSVFRVDERKLVIGRAILWSFFFFIIISLCIDLLPLLIHGNQWDERTVDFVCYKQPLWQFSLFCKTASLSWTIWFLVPRLWVYTVYVVRVSWFSPRWQQEPCGSLTRFSWWDVEENWKKKAKLMCWDKNSWTEQPNDNSGRFPRSNKHHTGNTYGK